MKKYKARKGAPFGNDKADIYGKHIDKLIIKNKGSITPKIVVDDAKKTSSPLHEYFEWKDKTASEKYRIHQARILMNSIVVEVIIEGKKPREQRAMLNVDLTPNIKESNRVYVTYQRALSEKELRKQILETALREIKYWQQKYYEYRELSLIFKAILKTQKKIKI